MKLWETPVSIFYNGTLSSLCLTCTTNTIQHWEWIISVIILKVPSFEWEVESYIILNGLKESVISNNKKMTERACPRSLLIAVDWTPKYSTNQRLLSQTDRSTFRVCLAFENGAQSGAHVIRFLKEISQVGLQKVIFWAFLGPSARKPTETPHKIAFFYADNQTTFYEKLTWLCLGPMNSWFRYSFSEETNMPSAATQWLVSLTACATPLSASLEDIYQL